MKALQEAYPLADPAEEASAWPPELVTAYTGQRLGLVRLAFLITGDRHAAEEIVHDAFLATLRSWERVRDPAPYLHTTVVNRSRSWLKRRGVEQRHLTLAPPDATAEPDELWDVLARLKPRARAAVVLRYYEGLPDAAIAEVLGCRVSTVRTTIHRALGALRKEIER